jgi:hypothetical protein
MVRSLEKTKDRSIVYGTQLTLHLKPICFVSTYPECRILKVVGIIEFDSEKSRLPKLQHLTMNLRQDEFTEAESEKVL